jgi:hypothetical protein
VTDRRPTSLAAYARTIEKWWSEFLDAPVVLSPRDWRLIDRWYEAGVPLEVVREALDDTAERARGRRSRSAPRGLGFLSKAVDEGLSAIRDGRVGATGAPPGDPAPEDAPSGEPGPGDAADRWRKRGAEEPADSPLRALFLETLAALEGGRPAEELDREVDSRLRIVLPPEAVREIEAAVSRELEPFRGRIEPARLESTRDKAVASRLRERFRIPRLVG